MALELPIPFWKANQHYHTLEDASDRLAIDPSSPSGVTYDYAFATELTRAVVALVVQEALPASGPASSKSGKN